MNNRQPKHHQTTIIAIVIAIINHHPHHPPHLNHICRKVTIDLPLRGVGSKDVQVTQTGTYLKVMGSKMAKNN